MAFFMRRAPIAYFMAMVMMAILLMMVVMMFVGMTPDRKRFAGSIGRLALWRCILSFIAVFDEMQVRAMVRVMVMKEGSRPGRTGV